MRYIETVLHCIAFCPLSGIEKRPFLGGWFCTKAVVISIRTTDFVRCREVVLLSEGPLWEVRLYIKVTVHYSAFVMDSLSPSVVLPYSSQAVEDINSLLKCWNPKLTLRAVAYNIVSF